MAQTKAFIFDLDGVIVDTARFHYLAWKEIARKLGYDFGKLENEKLKGISRVESLNLILEWHGKEIDQKEKDTLLKEKNQIYLKYIESISIDDVLPGVLDLIQYLKNGSIKIALGSASKNARPVLLKLGISDLFDAIVDGTNVSNSKPDPEVFIIGAQALGVPCTNCLVIEDSEAGIAAAKQIEMKTIAVGDAKQLDRADYKCMNLNDINTRLLKKIIES